MRFEKERCTSQRPSSKFCRRIVLTGIAALALTGLSSNIASASQPFCSGKSSTHLETLYYAGSNGTPYMLEADPGVVFSWRQIPTMPVVAEGSGMACYIESTSPAVESLVYVYTFSGQLSLVKLWGDMSGSRSYPLGQPPVAPTAGTFVAENLTVEGGGKAVAAGSAVVGYTDSKSNTEFVYYIGSDNHVHVLSGAIGPLLKEDANLDNTAEPSVATGSSLTGQFTGGGDEVFYIGTDGHIHELWRWSTNFDGWHETDLSIANGMKTLPLAGAPLACLHDFTAGVDAIFYVGVDFGIYETFMSAQTQGWAQLNLSGQTGYTGFYSSTMTAQVDPLTGTERMYIVSGDQVVAFWASPSEPATWSANWIPPAAAADGAPVAANGGAWDNLEWAFTTDGNGDIMAYVAEASTGGLSWYFANNFSTYASPAPPVY